MTVGTPVPFEVEKNALRPSGCSSLVSGKTPSIVLPSYSFQSSIVDRPVLGIGQGESREGKGSRRTQTSITWMATHRSTTNYYPSLRGTAQRNSSAPQSTHKPHLSVRHIIRR